MISPGFKTFDSADSIARFLSAFKANLGENPHHLNPDDQAETFLPRRPNSQPIITPDKIPAVQPTKTNFFQ